MIVYLISGTIVGAVTWVTYMVKFTFYLLVISELSSTVA